MTIIQYLIVGEIVWITVMYTPPPNIDGHPLEAKLFGATLAVFLWPIIILMNLAGFVYGYLKK